MYHSRIRTTIRPRTSHLSCTKRMSNSWSVQRGLIAILEETRQQLLDHGLMSSAGVLENDIRRERRRFRALSREDPGVLMAVARARDAEEARDRKRRIEIADANSRIMTRHKLQQKTDRRCRGSAEEKEGRACCCRGAPRSTPCDYERSPGLSRGRPELRRSHRAQTA